MQHYDNSNGKYNHYLYYNGARNNYNPFVQASSKFLHFSFSSIKQVTEVTAFFVTKLGASYFPHFPDKTPGNALVEMFHGKLDPETEAIIPQEFKKADSVVQCIVATVAFGLGMNIPDVDTVIHWGPSSSILSYW